MLWVHLQKYHVTIHVTVVECLTNRSHKSNILIDSAKPSLFSGGRGEGAGDRHHMIVDKVVVTGV